MKNERQRTRDLALLSAYLDGELRPAERQALVARLQTDPDLGERLENLRKTKLTVGYLPRVRAPHNFTLTPEMVTVRPKKAQPFAATMRLTSALAAILLVVLFGAEFLITSGSLARLQMDAEPMMEAAVVLDDAEPEPLIVWGHPGVGGAEGFVEGRGGDGPVTMAEPVMVESMPVEVEVAVEEEIILEESPVVDSEAEILPEEAPELLLEADVSPPTEKEIEALQVVSGMDGEMLILGINLEEGGEIISRSADTVVVEEARPAWLGILRVLQVALGAIVVGGGLAWWLLSRRG